MHIYHLIPHHQHHRGTIKPSNEKLGGKGAATISPSYEWRSSESHIDDDYEEDYFPSGQRQPERSSGADCVNRQYGLLHGRPVSAAAPRHLSNHEFVHVARPASALGASDRAALRSAAAATASVARNSGGGAQNASKYQW